MNLWLVVITAGLLTFLIRLSFIAWLANRDLPALAQRALGLVPPAVLAAIVLPELLVRQGEIAFGPDNFRLVAGVIAVAVAWRSRRVVPTIAAGMGSLWLLQYFAGAAS